MHAFPLASENHRKYLNKKSVSNPAPIALYKYSYATLATFSGQIVNSQKEQAGKPKN